MLAKIANIYRPPSTSKPTFIDEFADLLSPQASTNDFLLAATLTCLV